MDPHTESNWREWEKLLIKDAYRLLVAENEKLRQQIEDKERAVAVIRKFGTVYVFPSEWNCASEGRGPSIDDLEKYDVSQLP